MCVVTFRADQIVEDHEQTKLLEETKTRLQCELPAPRVWHIAKTHQIVWNGWRSVPSKLIQQLSLMASAGQRALRVCVSVLSSSYSRRLRWWRVSSATHCRLYIALFLCSLPFNDTLHECDPSSKYALRKEVIRFARSCRSFRYSVTSLYSVISNVCNHIFDFMCV